MSDFGPLTDRREAMAIAASMAVVPMALGGPALAASPPLAPAMGRNQGFEHGWRFYRGEGTGFELADFDDVAWRKLDLPHDWSIEDAPGGHSPKQIGPFDAQAIGGTATGFSQGGEGWYRKHFTMAALPEGSRAEVAFDGIYGQADIWLNGHPLGTHYHGYTPFALDLTPFLRRDRDNVLAVRVRNMGQNSRWYSGSGVTRQVSLDITPAPTRIARWGVGGWTRRVSNGRAQIDVTTTLEGPVTSLELVARLRNALGGIVAEIRSPAGAQTRQVLAAKAPRLWSPQDPYLHVLEVELLRGGKVIDRMVQPFGIRIIAMDAQRGMTINGQRVILRGGCLHHDNGLLGAAAFADAEERRVLLLKARGYNAIRSSHNPSSRHFREACDRHGMLLIEEAFDMWHAPKLPDDFSNHFAAHWESVITAMVQSARNSPSVIMWSIGNEIPERATPAGVEWAWKLANAVRRLDPTRPVTAAINGVLGARMIASAATARDGRAGLVDNAATIFLDVPGYNYRLEDIEAEQAEHPERIVYASETFANEMLDYAALAARAPYFLGEFVWTAMDYLGEAGIGATTHLKKGNPPFFFPGFPWVNAWCGDIDLIGQQKPPSLARDVVWGVSPLEISVQRPVPDGSYEYVSTWGWSDELASWSWDVVGGQPLAVRIHTSGDRVDLRLNGQLLGTRALSAKDKMRAEFMVSYAPGRLEAIAYRGGSVIGRKALETVSSPAQLRLTAQHAVASRDRQALHYITIAIADAKGRLVPDDQRQISLDIKGPANLLALGSANPLAVGSFQAQTAQSYRGRALAILRSQGADGLVRIEAHAEGLASGIAHMRLE